MPRVELPIGRRQTPARNEPASGTSSRKRLDRLLALFAFGVAIIFARMVQLQWTSGAAFRSAAARPVIGHKTLMAHRGRILARDGSPLAEDQAVLGLTLDYRWLRSPPQDAWLRAEARSRLPKTERNRPERIAEAERQVVADRGRMQRELAALVDLTDDEFQRRTQHIQMQVEEISRRVNARQQTEGGEPIIVSEEIAGHLLADIETATAEIIAASPERFPGVKIVERNQRVYPRGPLAAHVVGYLGRPTAEELSVGRDEAAQAAATVASAIAPPPDRDSLIGRSGVELARQTQLAGRAGLRVERRDHRGKLLESSVATQPQTGIDVHLTLDLNVQLAAEQYLDAAIVARRTAEPDQSEQLNTGGAAVVLDVAGGELLALASSPRFDPNAFVDIDAQRAAETLRDAARPLWNRAMQMTLPPGSVFKVLSAIALLESGTLSPDDTVDCRGYLHQPERLRCAIYRQHGIGHGPVTLAEALAQSCNVYFFHFAEKSGPGPILDWSQRFGFGQRTGVDLPAEAAGNLPHEPAANATEQSASNEAMTLAIGQGELTVTPLQVARMMAAVANGGKLVTPHVVERDAATSPATPIAKLSPQTLAAVQTGLEHAVSDPRGTAHSHVQLDSLTIAGKTGTAEAGGGRPDHAWFAAYAPVDHPRVAVVVVLEHGGGGGEAAGPIVRRILQRMQELGYFGKNL